MHPLVWPDTSGFLHQMSYKQKTELEWSRGGVGWVAKGKVMWYRISEEERACGGRGNTCGTKRFCTPGDDLGLKPCISTEH